MSTNKSTSEIDSNDFNAPVSIQTNVIKDRGEAKSQQYNNKIDKDDNNQIIQGDKNIINNIIKMDISRIRILHFYALLTDSPVS